MFETQKHKLEANSHWGKEFSELSTVKNEANSDL